MAERLGNLKLFMREDVPVRRWHLYLGRIVFLTACFVAIWSLPFDRTTLVLLCRGLLFAVILSLVAAGRDREREGRVVLIVLLLLVLLVILRVVSMK